MMSSMEVESISEDEGPEEGEIEDSDGELVEEVAKPPTSSSPPPSSRPPETLPSPPPPPIISGHRHYMRRRSQISPPFRGTIPDDRRRRGMRTAPPRDWRSPQKRSKEDTGGGRGEGKKPSQFQHGGRDWRPPDAVGGKENKRNKRAPSRDKPKPDTARNSDRKRRHERKQTRFNDSHASKVEKKAVAEEEDVEELELRKLALQSCIREASEDNKTLEEEGDLLTQNIRVMASFLPGVITSEVPTKRRKLDCDNDLDERVRLFKVGVLARQPAPSECNKVAETAAEMEKELKQGDIEDDFDESLPSPTDMQSPHMPTPGDSPYDPSEDLPGVKRWEEDGLIVLDEVGFEGEVKEVEAEKKEENDEDEEFLRAQLLIDIARKQKEAKKTDANLQPPDEPIPDAVSNGKQTELSIVPELPEPSSHPHMQPKPNLPSELEIQPSSETSQQFQPKTQPIPEPKADVKPDELLPASTGKPSTSEKEHSSKHLGMNEVKVQPKPSSKPQLKQSPKPQPKPQSKPQMKPPSKPQSKPSSKPQLKQATKSLAKSPIKSLMKSPIKSPPKPLMQLRPNPYQKPDYKVKSQYSLSKSRNHHVRAQASGSFHSKSRFHTRHSRESQINALQLQVTIPNSPENCSGGGSSKNVASVSPVNGTYPASKPARIVINLGEDESEDEEERVPERIAKLVPNQAPSPAEPKSGPIMFELENQIERLLRKCREESDVKTNGSTVHVEVSAEVQPTAIVPKVSAPSELGKTPKSVKHLPASQQVEYERLKQEIRKREMVKLVNSVSPKAAILKAAQKSVQKAAQKVAQRKIQNSLQMTTLNLPQKTSLGASGKTPSSPQKAVQKFLQKVQSSPQKTVQSSPQKTVQSSPQKTVQSSTQNTVQSSPQKTSLGASGKAPSSPQKAVQKSLQKVQSSPQKTVQSSPQKTVQSSPQKTVQSSTQKTVQSSPQKAVQNSPQKTPVKSQRKGSQMPKTPQKSSLKDLLSSKEKEKISLTSALKALKQAVLPTAHQNGMKGSGQALSKNEDVAKSTAKRGANGVAQNMVQNVTKDSHWIADSLLTQSVTSLVSEVPHPAVKVKKSVSDSPDIQKLAESSVSNLGQNVVSSKPRIFSTGNANLTVVHDPSLATTCIAQHSVKESEIVKAAGNLGQNGSMIPTQVINNMRRKGRQAPARSALKILTGKGNDVTVTQGDSSPDKVANPVTADSKREEIQNLPCASDNSPNCSTILEDHTSSRVCLIPETVVLEAKLGTSVESCELMTLDSDEDTEKLRLELLANMQKKKVEEEEPKPKTRRKPRRKTLQTSPGVGVMTRLQKKRLSRSTDETDASSAPAVTETESLTPPSTASSVASCSTSPITSVVTFACSAMHSSAEIVRVSPAVTTSPTVTTSPAVTAGSNGVLCSISDSVISKAASNASTSTAKASTSDTKAASIANKSCEDELTTKEAEVASRKDEVMEGLDTMLNLLKKVHEEKAELTEANERVAHLRQMLLEAEDAAVEKEKGVAGLVKSVKTMREHLKTSKSQFVGAVAECKEVGSRLKGQRYTVPRGGVARMKARIQQVAASAQWLRSGGGRNGIVGGKRKATAQLQQHSEKKKLKTSPDTIASTECAINDEMDAISHDLAYLAANSSLHGASPKLEKYHSPLDGFHSWRNCDGQDASFKLDPQQVLCHFELMGKCNDDNCPYQHHPYSDS